jgi:hypothetical protein
MHGTVGFARQQFPKQHQVPKQGTRYGYRDNPTGWEIADQLALAARSYTAEKGTGWK